MSSSSWHFFVSSFKPLEQFDVNVYKPVIFKFGNVWLDISFTDLTCTLFIYLLILSQFIAATKFFKIIPTSFQIFIEGVFDFVKLMVLQQIGSRAQPFFPLVLTLFILILSLNYLGMTPYSSGPTSHLICVFVLTFGLFLGSTLLGFLYQGLHFLMVFYPSGAPALLTPFLVFLEVLSFFVKVVSLPVRLFANIMSGHILLYMLASFVLKIGKFSFFLGVFPLSVLLAAMGLEVIIGFLQAYVFCILFLIYLKDSFEVSH